MNEVVQRLQLLHPEMALFVTTCVVMVLGLARSLPVRKSAGVVTALGLLVAAWLAWRSPTDNTTAALRGAVFPAMLPFAKTLIALVGLLILPLLTGTVDRAYERSIVRGARFDPIRATRGEFYAFFLFSLTGVMLCAGADDLIWLFLALELTSLPTYVMVAMSAPRLRAQEAGVKYFFLGAFGAAIFLYGFALIYGATGTTSLPGIRAALEAAVNRGEPPLNNVALVGFVMAMLGVSFKIAAAPMHFYAPDVYQGAATPVTAYLAFAPKAAGFLALLLLLGTIGWTFGPLGTSLPPTIRVTLWVMAALTMTIGNVLALLQQSVKRILAYSSIAHSGYMITGLVVGPGRGNVASDGLAATMFYLACYGVMNVGAFAVLAALEKRSPSGEMEEVETIDDLRGLCASRPALGWAMVLSALSLAGFPPLLGFFAKLALFTSLWSAHEGLLLLVLAVNSAVGAVYYIRLARAPLLESREDMPQSPRRTEGLWRPLAAVASATGVVALVVAVTPLTRASKEATRLGRTMDYGSTPIGAGGAASAEHGPMELSARSASGGRDRAERPGLLTHGE